MAQSSPAQVSSWLSKVKYETAEKVEAQGYSSIFAAKEVGTKKLLAVKVYNHREHEDRFNEKMRVKIKLEVKLYLKVRDGVSTLIGTSYKQFFPLQCLACFLWEAFLIRALLTP